MEKAGLKAKAGFTPTHAPTHAAPRKTLPGDPYLRLVLLYCHLIGLGVWYGGSFLGFGVPILFPILAGASGLLLIVRGLLNGGFGWLLKIQGLLSLLMLVMAVLAYFLSGNTFIFLTIAIVLGASAANLPSEIGQFSLLRK